MQAIESENLVLTPNKKDAADIIVDRYFSNILDREFKVSYIIVTEEDKEGNLINKIINKIFDSVELDEYPNITNKNNFILSWQSNDIKVNINSELSENKSLLWEVVFEGGFVILEEFRTNFLAELTKDSRYKKKYCVQDEISDTICIAAYPMIRELENDLRDYLLRFFTRKFGSKWWERSKTPQLEVKVKERERTFGGLLDLQLYSIDFIDLIELLDGKARVENHDIVNALEHISNSRGDEDKFDKKIENLKNKLVGNWEKFFEEHITVGNFIAVWKDIYSIRCDVAHNSFMNLTRFNRLVDCHSQIKKQLIGLIDELRIVKTGNNQILEKVIDMNIILSKTDIESFLEYNIIYLTPANFKKNSLSQNEFNNLFKLIVDDLNQLGDFTESEFQFNLDDEDGEFPGEDIKFASISKVLFYSSISDEVKSSLILGIKNKKFV